jgi:hypothetical protein
MNADTQRKAVLQLVDGIVESVRAAGPLGAPGGLMYAALMAHGCTLSQFQTIMGTLVDLGKLERRGQLYFVGAV